MKPKQKEEMATRRRQVAIKIMKWWGRGGVVRSIWCVESNIHEFVVEAGIFIDWWEGVSFGFDILTARGYEGVSD